MLSDSTLNSDLVYPPIIRHGSVPFSNTGSPVTVYITDLLPEEDYFIFIEEAVGIRVPAYYDFIYNGTNAVYRVGNSLYIFINDIDVRTGTVYWRVYGDRS